VTTDGRFETIIIIYNGLICACVERKTNCSAHAQSEQLLRMRKPLALN